MSLKQKYEKSLNEKWCMRFKTTHPDGDNYDGIVTHIKPNFIAMREEVDFELDGVMIFPKRSIKGFRDDMCDQCCNEILKHNGALKKLRPIRWLDSCETIPQIISVMMRRGIWPGIETRSEQKEEWAFYIGPITALGSKQFALWCYDPAGQWEKEYTISYSDIFRIELDSRYCNHFNEYMQANSGA